jgi:hypothetical protein
MIHSAAGFILRKSLTYLKAMVCDAVEGCFAEGGKDRG